jgi:alpha-galactosidase
MNDQLALTPPMGWNSWNTFAGNIHETLIKETADAMVNTGLKAAGYTHVVIDDHWHGGRDEQGRLYPDPEKFPSGMLSLANYIHSLGLKFGIYSDAGTKTCGGQPGSMGFEELDAQTFASWGVDFLKYDYCYAPEDRGTAEKLFRTMGDALKAAGRARGRPILFNLCEWGTRRPWLWGRQVGGHMWRATGDIWDGWTDGEKEWQNGILSIIDMARGLEAYAGPGGWNDLDMLEVGIHGHGNTPGVKGCTEPEYRTHFSMWCMLASPLFIGCDIRNMDDGTKEILTHKEIIALNQDSAGKQGFRVRTGRTEAYKKNLAGGDLGVALLNRCEDSRTIVLDWSDLEISGTYRVRDLWAHADLENTSQHVTAEVAPHGCAVFRLSPV